MLPKTSLFPIHSAPKALLHFFVFIALYCCPGFVAGQTGCREISCNAANTFVQVIEDPAHPNLPGCQPSPPTACGGGDQFRQMFFIVRMIHYPSTTLLSGFDLDYESLDITIAQAVGNSSTLKLSHIDKIATKNCFDETALANGWTISDTDGVVFSADEQSANITFKAAGSCPDAAVIHFAPTLNCPPSGASCYSADLFTIVVNAYPDEVVQLMPSSVKYKKFSEECSPIISSNGTATAIVEVPNNAGGSEPNRFIQARLATPVANPDGSFDVAVELVNNHSTNAVNIDYLEFLVKVNADQDVALTTQNGYVIKKVELTASDTYLHFMVPDNGWTIASSGGVQTIDVIKIKPAINNITWNATFSFNDMVNSRAQSSNLAGLKSCTKLPYNATEQDCGNTGLDICSYDNEGVVFTVIGEPTGDCTYPFTQKVRVGLLDPTASHFLSLKELSFNLDITTTGPVSYVSTTAGSDWISGTLCPGSNLCSPCTTATSSTNLIQFSYCAEVSGTPFSMNLFNKFAFIELLFEGAGCVDDVTITSLAMKRNGDATACIPVYESAPYANIPICMGDLYGDISTEDGQGVEAVEVSITRDLSPPVSLPIACTALSCPDDEFLTGSGTGPSGGYGFCACSTCDYFDITPAKDINPLNGVTTYDLVLISKHILGITPLGSPYKMIAADANHTNSVTTADIVEIRKLILGINASFPANTSWRFVPKSHIFSNPSNPFVPVFPEEILHIDKSSPAVSNDFIGIKIGDVNNTVIPASRPATQDRPKTALSWPDYNVKTGAFITVPIVYSGTEALDALQMGLHFDPLSLQLISPSMGDLPGWGLGNFNLEDVSRGNIKTLWLPGDLSDAAQLAKPGDVLFYLTFKVLRKSPASGLPLYLDDTLLPCAAWRTDGIECALLHEIPAAARSGQAENQPGLLSASCYPNPGSADMTLRVDAITAGKGRIDLLGPFGNLVFTRNVLLEAGSQEIHIPEVAQLPAGVYAWNVTFGKQKARGHWVKQ